MKLCNVKQEIIILNELPPIVESGVRMILQSAGVNNDAIVSIPETNEFLEANCVDASLIISGVSLEPSRNLSKIKLLSRVIKNLTPAFIYTPLLDAFFYRFLLSLGVKGVMTEGEGEQVFANIIFALRENRCGISPVVKELIGDRLQSCLTPAEKPVIFDLLMGKSISEIATDYGRDVNTIFTQKVSAMRRLNLTSNTELYRLGGAINTFNKKN